MMKVTFHYKTGSVDSYEVDQAIAATRNFPQWAIWFPMDEDGKQKVSFIATDVLKKVDLYGTPEEEKPKGQLIPLRGGEDHRPVS